VKATAPVPLDRKLTNMTEHEFMLAFPYRKHGRAWQMFTQLLAVELQQPNSELEPAALPPGPMRWEPLRA
jgi:hypothetical protein